MSVKINIGPYRLESYSAGWTTGEPRVRTSGEGVVEEYLAHQRFHGSLTAALTALQDTWLRESSSESTEELLAELKAFRAEVAGLFLLQVREPDRNRHRVKIPA
ncbi:MAG: hypothetical protein V3T08_09220 [Gemmatimonadota bacterium]